VAKYINNWNKRGHILMVIYNIHVTFEYGCVWKTEGICKIITVKSFVKLGFSSCLYIIENKNQFVKNDIIVLAWYIIQDVYLHIINFIDYPDNLLKFSQIKFEFIVRKDL
jgi:hypothetical protein